MKKSMPKTYDEIPTLDEVDHATRLQFVSEEVLYTVCKDPKCRCVHLLMRYVGEPYVVGCTMNLEMAENLLEVAKLIHERKSN